MKVAIIGAGLAGLATAFQLDRYKIPYIVFDRRYQPGDPTPHIAVSLKVINRPVKDIVSYFYKKYDLPLVPYRKITKILMNSPGNFATVRGSNLGYFWLRGHFHNSLENQLLRLIKGEVRFKSPQDPEHLKDAFSHVVVATGSPIIANSYGIFHKLFDGWVIGSNISGNFDPEELVMWIDTDYAKNGYAYLTPFDTKNASLCLAINDITENQLSHYWQVFWQKEKLPYKIIETFTVNHIVGYLTTNQLNNIYFTGGAGGLIEPFLGFGIFYSIISGILVAKAIKENLSYDTLLNPIKQAVRQFDILRIGLNKLNNNSFDFLTGLLSFRPLNYLLYHLPFDSVKLISYLFAKGGLKR
ncbi:NAD(P)/FAD-dependent oxidoreductase [Carboxydothermus hydrogenoformans]|uniref:FAD/NAD(P)-binding domain-containing protein n=1 Tax=Carboxydothermus hydrogenoformans (strain ATCC BAA-161 / DSM 6008 / Z-2901) TaxID=246194 RepID=Q3ACA0_CARHZ|nr:FAD-dependent oxidoreductase [Carboxydothermus hydrogenoformans]ABB15801.1 conserved hypothetical protein [Carboxydothermus hydrogenoformans Z-2901]